MRTAFFGSTDCDLVALNPRGLLNWARSLDRFLQIEKKHGAVLEALAAKIQAIKDRLTKLEERVRKSWLQRPRALPRRWVLRSRPNMCRTSLAA